MKKIIFAVAVSAVAIMAVASAASASTPSYTPPAPITKQLEADTHFNGVTYVHKYTITMNLFGGFTGVANTGSIVPGEKVQGVLTPFGIAIAGVYPANANDPNYTWSYVGAYKGGAVLWQHDSHDLKWTTDFTVS